MSDKNICEIRVRTSCWLCEGTGQVKNLVWKKFSAENQGFVDESDVKAWFKKNGYSDPVDYPSDEPCPACNGVGTSLNWIPIERLQKILAMTEREYILPDETVEKLAKGK